MSARSTAKPRPRPKKRKFTDPGASYARRLERYRPGLVRFTLDGLADRYGRPVWGRRLDPTSELILTILTQNSADTNAEVAFEGLRRTYPGGGPVAAHNPGALRRYARHEATPKDLHTALPALETRGF